jgi:hypothetical protein
MGWDVVRSGARSMAAMTPCAPGVAMLAIILTMAAAHGEVQLPRPDFDAARLRQGTFRFHTMVDGKPAGQSEIEVRALPGGDRFRYSNLITGAFSQRWEAVATRRFEPVSASLTFGEGADIRPMFTLTYQKDRVTGTAMMRRQKPPALRVVDEMVSPDTVDQRIDWAAVMAIPSVETGTTVSFRVYDPETGESRINVEVGPRASTVVPAGTFETARIVYRIDKSRGPETYVALVHREPPRFLVHETFPNGSTTELVAVSR